MLLRVAILVRGAVASPTVDAEAATCWSEDFLVLVGFFFELTVIHSPSSFWAADFWTPFGCVADFLLGDCVKMFAFLSLVLLACFLLFPLVVTFDCESFFGDELEEAFLGELRFVGLCFEDEEEDDADEVFDDPFLALECLLGNICKDFDTYK